MPTPNLCVASETDPFVEVPQALRRTEVDVLYATDRMPEHGKDGTLAYTDDRSDSLAFGSCRVRIGSEDATWQELVEASRSRKRSKDFTMSVTAIEERGRFPETPLKVIEVDNRLVHDPRALSGNDEVAEELRAEVRRRLAQTRHKQALIFIHGFNVSYYKSVVQIAELWHFLGRRGIPIAYAWPARGNYGYDRESGEFTVHHLKGFIRVLASVPELQRIDILAHSRGTDVSTTAIRELFIEARGAGEDPIARYKIGNLILAAPDLDYDIVRQRIMAERVGQGVRRFTVYVSRTDKALDASTRLFASRRRFGRLRVEDISRNLTDLELGSSIIDANVTSSFLGHGYFHENPAVSSDLVLVLRYDLDSGAENGRPLERKEGIYWELTDDYMMPVEPQQVP